MFTTFLLLTSITIVVGLAALLAVRWRSAPQESRVPAAPIAVAAMTALLVALAFLVM